MRRRLTDDDQIFRMLEEGKTQKEIADHFKVSPAAICKRVKKLLPGLNSFQGLTGKEQVFVKAISKGSTQTDAAMRAFDVTSRDSAKSLGYQLMSKPDIKTAVRELMQQQGLTRSYRVRKLRQHVDNRDPNVSLRALDQTWKLDGAYSEEYVHKVNYEDLQRNLAEIDKEIADLEAQLRELDGHPS